MLPDCWGVHPMLAFLLSLAFVGPSNKLSYLKRKVPSESEPMKNMTTLQRE